MCISALYADTVTVKVCGPGETEIAASFTTELSKVSEGIYTIADFLHSGSSITFSFKPDIAAGANSAIKLTGNIEAEDNTWHYVLNSDGDYATAKIYASDNDDVTEIKPFYIYNTGSAKSYTYLKHLDKTTTGYEYCARFTVSGWLTQYVESEWYYLYMYFNPPSDTGISEITNDNRNVPAEYYNLNGQRINNPVNGVVIRKQGKKVEKIIAP